MTPNLSMSPQAAPRSPAAIGDEGLSSPMNDPNRRIGLQHDLQGDANKFANTSFVNHWEGQTKGLDLNNNQSVEDFANRYGVKRGRVGMSIDTGKNDMSGGALGGNGVRQIGEWHTMNNEELLAAAKSRAREHFANDVTSGVAPKSPAGLAPYGPIGPTPTGAAQGGAAPVSPDTSGADTLAGYQNRLAGMAPDQAPMIARRTGMQPYDVANEQSATQARQTMTAALPGQIAAQTGLVNQQAAAHGANAAKLNAEATTLIPAQAQEAIGKGQLAAGEGKKAQATAGGALTPEAHQKILNDMQNKHQQELQALTLKLTAAQERVHQLTGNGGKGNKNDLGAQPKEELVDRGNRTPAETVNGGGVNRGPMSPAEATAGGAQRMSAPQPTPQPGPGDLNTYGVNRTPGHAPATDTTGKPVKGEVVERQGQHFYQDGTGTLKKVQSPNPPANATHMSYNPEYQEWMYKMPDGSVVDKDGYKLTFGKGKA